MLEKINFFLKPFINVNFLSAIFNIIILFIFTKGLIGYNSFIDFFTSEDGIWFNIIFTYILIHNIQTPYFQPPKDIFLNSLSLLLLIIPTITFLNKNDSIYIFNKTFFYYVLILILIFLIFYTLYTTVKFSKEKVKNITLTYKILDKVVIRYNILFLVSILISASVYKKTNDIYLIIICYLIISFGFVDKMIEEIFKIFESKKSFYKIKNYGELYRIDEPNIYRVILNEQIEKNKLLLLQQENEIIKLYPLSVCYTKDGKIYTCIKYDILIIDNKAIKKQAENNIIFDIRDLEEKNNNYKDVIGFVVENSNINSIKFELTSNDILKESDIIYFLNKENKEVFYQVVNGITHEENLNNNFIGNQIVEAMQLGILNQENKLLKYSWFPNMNEKIYKYNAGNCKCKTEENSFYIGNCSGLNLPIKIDIDKLITYHTAILGVTGTGKSTLAFKIIEEVSKNHKVICIDITGEYKNKLSSYYDMNISEQEFKSFEEFYTKLEGNFPNKNAMNNAVSTVIPILNSKIENFFKEDNDKNVAVFEFAEFINTSSNLKITELFLKAIFTYKKQNCSNNNKILIVLEEAHTLAPEWNFIGIDDKNATASTQAISQIALQGRKYEIGLLLVSQRTALVSKTILSQCNTFFTFSLIDQTSLDFLRNFYGETQIKIIPNLEKYHLIAYGVAIESERPVIINTENNKE